MTDSIADEGVRWYTTIEERCPSMFRGLSPRCEHITGHGGLHEYRSSDTHTLCWPLTSDERHALEISALEDENRRLHEAGQRLHDKMDDLNANTPDGAVCWFCGETGYDGDGLHHAANCVITGWRALTQGKGTGG